MSEIVIFVESITGAGWLFLSALVVLSLGFVLFDRRPSVKTGAQESSRPASRRAA